MSNSPPKAGPSRQTRVTDEEIPPSSPSHPISKSRSGSRSRSIFSAVPSNPDDRRQRQDTVSTDPLAFSDDQFSPDIIRKASNHAEEGSKAEEEEDEIEIQEIEGPIIHRQTAKRTQGNPIGKSNKQLSTSTSLLNKTSSPVPNRRRIRPIVEIPLMPLIELRKYAHLRRDTANPTEKSRKRLLGETSEGSSYDSSEGSSSIVQTARRRNRGSSASFGDDHMYGSQDDTRASIVSMDLSEESEMSDEDGIALRRSHRSQGFDRRETRDDTDGLIAGRTRAKNPVAHNPSPISISSSSESEDARAFTSKKGRGRPRKNMVLPSKRKRKESEDDFVVFSSSSDGLFSDLSSESNYGKPNKKGKAKAKVTKVEIPEDVLYTHRGFCEKCSREPADDILERAIARKDRKNKKKRRDDADDEISDEELAEILEGWIECDKCVVSSHWGCLAPNQKKEVLAALREQDGPLKEGERLRKSVAIDESAVFTCAKCILNPDCFVCHKDDLRPPNEKPKEGDAEEANGREEQQDGNDDEMKVDRMTPEKKEDDGKGPTLKFRCLRCKQCVHYEHLEVPHSLGDDPSLPEVADHYQNHTGGRQAWICHQCRAFIWTVDAIIAWRPSPPNAKEPELEDDEKANWKDTLPREYLVKWTGRSFRHVTWVPHPWLQVLSAQRLRRFLEKGPALDLITDETLAAKGDEIAEPTIAKLTAEDDTVTGRRSGFGHDQNGQDGKTQWKGIGPGPEADAEGALPIEWSTIDRVLDVMLLPPSRGQNNLQKRGKRIMSTSLSASASGSPLPDFRSNGNFVNSANVMRQKYGLKDGQEPPRDMQMDIDLWEEKTNRDLDEDDIDEVAGLVTWCFVKWDDLQYDQSTWDTPPPATSPLYPAFKRALARFLRARKVDIPVLTGEQRTIRDSAAAGLFNPPKEQSECIVGGTLMPFQMQGFQWLLTKHFRRESCILADDMGLGKTIQIASVLGYLGSNKYKIYPCLVIVPNSTITNWVREFEKWVPHMRIVPYYGEAASRKIISKYELYHRGMQNKAAGLKAHVVLTTYDMITGNEFRVFGNIPRWEVLCVDEGQRLKSDGSLIFNRLKTLNSVHRILLTGTPLNNNLRELFNLLNFLDPVAFRDLYDLEKRFLNLNESLVTELHEMIKPFILRRIKGDVLKLPPKIEIIVPISLTPLQKQVYKGVFERNAELIQVLLRARKKKLKSGR
ncbi:uncharacterized protein IL334_004887 [Kwoniella shivajii]|uniref:Helicase ATP-binding domain-containing protein n=1 Tax=Kwoniella shivajii TaxID=564305 RepID=A0ABZ1D1L7_9TREE|nr:hypothetical protein IL334_004887 [Kwoniella shivajii]